MVEKSVDDIIADAFKQIDPRHGTAFEKSRTSFLSFSPSNFQISISTFLARQLGCLSGDRICFIQHKSNPLVWLFFKTTQKYHSVEIKIRNGAYSANSKEFVDQIGKAFDFETQFKGRIRLYVNMASPLKHRIADGDGGTQESVMYQLYDIPQMRSDFINEVTKNAYCEKIKNSDYILKKQS